MSAPDDDAEAAKIAAVQQLQRRLRGEPEPSDDPLVDQARAVLVDGRAGAADAVREFLKG